ncbi:negative regulator of systemic acquired resistance SNI1 isoform X2 [Juglans microcarpa x Juglans regia]|uniref:negative regulator of systemic acquired resistance SNI1 isoform X2 n=1 Tax=Juglans microcarpa x Juglans regia TaxID=2249226 RepID=UPI001B7DB08E|nr:negative regulator of systemic acquired resistance SNI1 isoform X2 [Juglans microcarpa x Juglans regia]
MENSIGRGGIEENILAILDASETKENRDANDDRIAFLEAVRAASIVPESGIPPTNKMCAAVFRILRVGKSLELIMPSFQLLNELDKRYPRLYLSGSDRSKSSSSAPLELVLVKEAWSPFVADLGTSSSEKEVADKNLGGPFDSSGFHLLIQDLAEVARDANFKTLDTKTLGSMLVFQYLLNVLEGDMLPRKSGETMNWTLLRESLLNMVLGSRKLNCKVLVRDCLTVMCGLYQIQSTFSNDPTYLETSVAKPSDNCDPAVAVALPEIGNNTCIAVQKLLTLIMELDMSKKEADMQGYTTRADGVRTPLIEVILDELTYNDEILSPFFQVFNDPKWKLEIILQYIWKYTPKPPVRTRRSNGSTDDATLSGALKCFSSTTSTKSIIKKIGIEVIQLLLAHAFKAHLFLSSRKRPALGDPDSKEDVRDNPLVEICENMISAFNSLRRVDENMEVLSFGKEALFTAATILSTKS